MSFSLRTIVEGGVSGIQGLWTAAGDKLNEAGKVLDEKRKEARYHSDRFTRSADAGIQQHRKQSLQTLNALYNYDLTTPARATVEAGAWAKDQVHQKLTETQQHVVETAASVKETVENQTVATVQGANEAQRNWRRGLADLISPD